MIFVKTPDGVQHKASSPFGRFLHCPRGWDGVKKEDMTESIFDPTGPETEHSGTRNLGPEAGNISHMPPEIIEADAAEDGGSALDEDAQTEQIAKAEREANQSHGDQPNPGR